MIFPLINRWNPEECLNLKVLKEDEDVWTLNDLMTKLLDTKNNFYNFYWTDLPLDKNAYPLSYYKDIFPLHFETIKSGDMTLFVKTLTGKTIRIYVDPFTTVYGIKVLI